VHQDQFDFQFRPPTYWPELEDDEAAINRIKGKDRRDRAREIVDAGGRLPEAEGGRSFFDENLPDDEREIMGRIHPALMGGEYLPDLEDSGVEIARVELDSVTADVISIRATRDGELIRYEVVDEYDIERKISPETSATPLEMGQLVELIDTARDEYDQVGLTDLFRDNTAQFMEDPKDAVNFVTVSSPFYPELRAYYEFRAQEWLRAKLASNTNGE
jgi:hypothetical protein